ncbi:putative ABC transporter permease [Dysosmobacter sp. Sow4_B12]|uniref:putative ABC transporter permease n=1 Tax=Dysosmobacter sp. Sow4_B12 TaxID=3438777 RepID=UPI003F9351F3
MKRNIQSYFLYFLLYAILGWLYEVFLEVVIYRWGYSDRGVLFGPYCPVYGVGAMVFLLCFGRLIHKREPRWLRWVMPLLMFLGCMAVATAIELATSYVLEALTGAWPWQTYTNYTVNFQGRIALSPSIRFGLGGVLFLYVIQPLFERLVGRLSPSVRSVAFWTALAVFTADCAATVLTKL